MTTGKRSGPLDSGPPHQDSRVVITGLGVVTPIGSSVTAFYDALADGRTAQPGVPIEEFGARGSIDPAKLRRIPRLGQFCIVAARQALGLQAGQDLVDLDARFAGAYDQQGQQWRDRIGVVLGTGLGALEQTMEFTAGYLKSGPEGASPALFPTTVMNASAALVAMELGLRGVNLTVNHRDLSVLEAVALARDQLLCGRADAIVAGGCDELGPWTAHAYARLGALSKAGVTRPYDRRRDGFQLGEGAVIVLLERLEAAQRRGAPILAEIAGIGRGGDDRPRLGWPTPGQPTPGRQGQDRPLEVSGAVFAVRDALREAQLPSEELDFIAGSGNGSALDLLETTILREALGAAAQQVRIASIIGQVGESMASAGPRLAAALYALSRQAVPGTSSCEEPDEEASLPGLCLRPASARVSSVLIPTFAQGGGNVALVLRPPP